MPELKNEIPTDPELYRYFSESYSHLMEPQILEYADSEAMAGLLLEMEAAEEARALLELCARSKSAFISEWAQGVLALTQAGKNPL